jgi:DNA-binding GntR family transcriptional regulator
MHIAKEYGTSQGPVREALRELEMLGFVRSEPHRGTYVRDPWQRGMLELYELRGALEEFAARMATPKLRDDTSALQAEVDAMAARPWPTTSTRPSSTASASIAASSRPAATSSSRRCGAA